MERKLSTKTVSLIKAMLCLLGFSSFMVLLGSIGAMEFVTSDLVFYSVRCIVSLLLFIVSVLGSNQLNNIYPDEEA